MRQISRLEQIPASQTPQEHCAWCWYVQHPHVNFPEQVSSTICPGHQHWLLAQAGARRLVRRNEVMSHG